jgi:1-acyl-sn-glycerol-3-phosphate acyltransferase
LLVGLRIKGLEHVPAKGPVLMVANHLHNADPVLLMAVFPRPIRFMAKKELFGVPVIGWVVRQVGAFPVDRSSPVREVRTLHQAEQLLAEGIIVGIFAEGTRSVSGGLQEAHPGVAMLALHSGAPILPTAIFGTEVLPFNGRKGRRWGKGRPRVTVRIGSPFYLRPISAPHRHHAFVELTDVIMMEIARLLPPRYRGIYAERVEATHTGQAGSLAGRLGSGP